MISTLPPPTEEHPDPREELDRLLETELWTGPRGRKYDDSDVPAGAPTWWHGDEEATDSFLRGMNIRLGPNGEVLPG